MSERLEPFDPNQRRRPSFRQECSIPSHQQIIETSQALRETISELQHANKLAGLEIERLTSKVESEKDTGRELYDKCADLQTKLDLSEKEAKQHQSSYLAAQARISRLEQDLDNSTQAQFNLQAETNVKAEVIEVQRRELTLKRKEASDRSELSSKAKEYLDTITSQRRKIEGLRNHVVTLERRAGKQRQRLADKTTALRTARRDLLKLGAKPLFKRKRDQLRRSWLPPKEKPTPSSDYLKPLIDLHPGLATQNLQEPGQLARAIVEVLTFELNDVWNHIPHPREDVLVTPTTQRFDLVLHRLKKACKEINLAGLKSELEQATQELLKVKDDHEDCEEVKTNLRGKISFLQNQSSRVTALQAEVDNWKQKFDEARFAHADLVTCIQDAVPEFKGQFVDAGNLKPTLDTIVLLARGGDFRRLLETWELPVPEQRADYPSVLANFVTLLNAEIQDLKRAPQPQPLDHPVPGSVADLIFHLFLLLPSPRRNLTEDDKQVWADLTLTLAKTLEDQYGFPS